ncbi:MAG: radical SAM protein, partial [Thermoprotei archaeon]
RDLDIISTGNVAVSITITTLDPEIAKRIEPNAPDPNERLIAVRTLAENGVPVIVRIDPIIPYVNDDLGMIEDLVSKIIRAGAKHIVTSTFKARRDSLKRLKALFPEKGDAIMDAYLVHGVRMKRNVFYLSKDLRKRILGNIAKYVLNEGVSFAVCREGFKEYMKALSCDGSHLIPLRVRTNHLI